MTLLLAATKLDNIGNLNMLSGRDLILLSDVYRLLKTSHFFNSSGILSSKFSLRSRYVRLVRFPILGEISTILSCFHFVGFPYCGKTLKEKSVNALYEHLVLVWHERKGVYYPNGHAGL